MKKIERYIYNASFNCIFKNSASLLVCGYLTFSHIEKTRAVGSFLSTQLALSLHGNGQTFSAISVSVLKNILSIRLVNPFGFMNAPSTKVILLPFNSRSERNDSSCGLIDSKLLLSQRLSSQRICSFNTYTKNDFVNKFTRMSPFL